MSFFPIVVVVAGKIKGIGKKRFTKKKKKGAISERVGKKAEELREG